MARSKRSKRERKDKTIGFVLAVIGILLIGGFSVGAWWLRQIKEPLDADNCPRSGARAVYVIMIDRSDPISGQQAQGIRQEVTKIKNDARFGTRFDIYTFEGDANNEMLPMMRLCAPGRAEDANEFIQNPELMRRVWQERFSDVLDREIDSLLRVSSLPTSPIIESLRAAAITSFGPIQPGKIPLRLLLVSDMVQNTAFLSQFKTDSNFALLAKSPAWTILQPNLKGADVDILYLIRPQAKRGSLMIQSRGHQLFWEQLISASGGRLSSLVPM